MITAALESKEGRDVAIIDIPGSYLHTYVDKHGEQIIIIFLKGKLVELMVMVYKNMYRKHVTYEKKGNAMLYVEMNKALCGLLQNALIFYKKPRKKLEAYSFVINIYDLCVANDMIESHQMTVKWHMDDLKVSHNDPYQITKFASYL